MIGRYHGGLNNQAGFLAPFDSPWGDEYERGIASTFDTSPPIGLQSGKAFGGSVGAFFSFTASYTPLPLPHGFGGDSPQGLQSVVEVLPPWQRV